MLTSTRSESVREPEEIDFVDFIEERHDRMLRDLVLQALDTDGALAAVRFGQKNPLRRLGTVRPRVNPRVQSVKVSTDVSSVFLPGHAICPW